MNTTFQATLASMAFVSTIAGARDGWLGWAVAVGLSCAGLLVGAWVRS